LFHLISEHVFAGLPQMFTLALKTGSYEIPEGSELHLTLPDTLIFNGHDIKDGILKLPRCQPNQEVNINIEVFAALPVGEVHEQKIHKEVM